MCKASNKKETQSWHGLQAAMLTEHAPLSWKLPAWSQGQHRQCSSPASKPRAGVLPGKPLQGLLTFLRDLLSGWALTIVFCQSYIASMPTPGQEPSYLNPDSDHMDLTSWLDLGFVSSPCFHLLTSTFGWRLSTDLSWLPSSGTADLALFRLTLLCLPCCLDLSPLWSTLFLLNDKDTSAVLLKGKKIKSIKNK